MSWLLPLVAIVGLWAWTTGRWRRVRFGDVAAVAAGLLAFRLMTRAEWLPAAVGFAWTAWWFRPKRFRRNHRPADNLPLDEARALLELPRGADAAMVRQAHRRLIQRVHPDAGGSAELARRVNAARDALLAELGAR